MPQLNQNTNKINDISVTDDVITGRGGLLFFSRYLRQSGIIALFLSMFPALRKHNKGLNASDFFLQLLSFFFDGTSRFLSYFNHIKSDSGYAASLEMKTLASTDQMKRMFRAFVPAAIHAFRKVLLTMFLWRLRLKKPDRIELSIDTMVMDNDEALKREGVRPTYKKVKGYQPLHLIWDRKIVDAIFRAGDKHSNHANDVIAMVRRAVTAIRTKYKNNVTIILACDSGFFDEKNFRYFDEELGIAFVATGKMYGNVKEHVKNVDNKGWKRYANDHQEWEYTEWVYKAESWQTEYRGIYTRPVYDEKEQRLLEFERPDNVIITNLGTNPEVLKFATPEEKKEMTDAGYIIRTHHQRGADELPHRGFKNYASETLPMKRYAANQAYYYLSLISFFMFETFKEDVLSPVISIVSYADTVRRKALDFAAKFVKSGGQILMKVSRTVMKDLQCLRLWRKCQSPPLIEPLA